MVSYDELFIRKEQNDKLFLDVFSTLEQQKLRAEAREFAEKEYLPIADKIEKEGKFPHDLIRKSGQRGFWGTPFPREYGGRGLTTWDACIVQEEFSRIGAVLCTPMAASWFGTFPILKAGTPEQKKKYLTPLARGEKIAAITITEPNVGSDTARMETVATPGEGGYVLNGKKRFITNTGVAGVYLVFAITDRKVDPYRGMSAFIVEPEMKGFEVEELYKFMGWNGVQNGVIKFTNLRLPRENLLGREGEGFKILMNELDFERTIAAAGSVGQMRGAFEACVQRAERRVQFGRPIKDFEWVHFTLADMAAKIEAGSLLTYKAARLIDQGTQANMESAIAKIFTSDAAMEVTTDAVQIWGGDGYRNAYPLERYMRDAKIVQIGGGTNQILRMVAGREVYRRIGLKAPKPA
ncbi:MAG: acyl-CoA dehydrogenase family protein [Euryarchaeota archaeon]|nr:acyl-CoA dehydrogenase family protein [Euryarchaeota archaeon]